MCFFYSMHDNHFLGFQNYASDCNEDDRAFCEQYVKTKPSPVPQEFTVLANVLMIESGWTRPQTCEDALTLYINLVDSIEN